MFLTIDWVTSLLLGSLLAMQLHSEYSQELSISSLQDSEMDGSETLRVAIAMMKGMRITKKKITWTRLLFSIRGGFSCTLAFRYSLPTSLQVQ